MSVLRSSRASKLSDDRTRSSTQHLSTFSLGRTVAGSSKAADSTRSGWRGGLPRQPAMNSRTGSPSHSTYIEIIVFVQVVITLATLESCPAQPSPVRWGPAGMAETREVVRILRVKGWNVAARPTYTRLGSVIHHAASWAFSCVLTGREGRVHQIKMDLPGRGPPDPRWCRSGN